MGGGRRRLRALHGHASSLPARSGNHERTSIKVIGSPCFVYLPYTQAHVYVYVYVSCVYVRACVRACVRVVRACAVPCPCPCPGGQPLIARESSGGEG